MISKTRRGEQGAAMVEFALMMLILVPLLLYGFFISDAAYHQLEVQEAVLSTIWDFTARQHNVTKSGAGKWSDQRDAVQAGNRMEYSDHTSSFDDPGDVNGNKESHHNQLALHACFFGGSDGSSYEDTTSSSQITCQVDRQKDLEWMTILGSNGGALSSVLGAVLPQKEFGKADDITHGGLAYCWGKAWVYNFIVPEEFLQGFSHTKLSEKKDHTGTPTASSNIVHSIGGNGGLAGNVFLRDKAAISFDTWALDNAGDISPTHMSGANHPGPDNEFYRRVNILYGSSMSHNMGATSVTYLAVTVANTYLAGKAYSDVIYIPAIPYMDDTSIVSGLLPAGLGSLGGLLGNLGLEPSNPSGVYMTARWNPSGSDPGYGTKCNVITDPLACWTGPKYMTTPWDPTNANVKPTWDNRGGSYMGSKDPNKQWVPE